MTVPPMKTNQHFPVEKGGGSGSDSSQLGKLIGLFNKIYNFSLFGVLNRVFWTGSLLKRVLRLVMSSAHF